VVWVLKHPKIKRNKHCVELGIKITFASIFRFWYAAEIERHLQQSCRCVPWAVNTPKNALNWRQGSAPDPAGTYSVPHAPSWIWGTTFRELSLWPEREGKGKGGKGGKIGEKTGQNTPEIKLLVTTLQIIYLNIYFVLRRIRLVIIIRFKNTYQTRVK